MKYFVIMRLKKRKSLEILFESMGNDGTMAVNLLLIPSRFETLAKTFPKTEGGINVGM